MIPIDVRWNIGYAVHDVRKRFVKGMRSSHLNKVWDLWDRVRPLWCEIIQNHDILPPDLPLNLDYQNVNLGFDSIWTFESSVQTYLMDAFDVGHSSAIENMRIAKLSSGTLSILPAWTELGDILTCLSDKPPRGSWSRDLSKYAYIFRPCDPGQEQATGSDTSRKQVKSTHCVFIGTHPLLAMPDATEMVSLSIH